MTDLTFADIEHLTTGRFGIIDVPCPICGPGCKSALNRKRRVLRIWRHEPDFATYKCQRCEVEGCARDKQSASSSAPARTAKPPADDDHAVRQSEKALHLWRRRQPVTGTVVETYLRSVRGYGGLIPATIGFLPPGKPEHHPAMIAAFGCATEPEPGVVAIGHPLVKGVHLTLLKPDGMGKADVVANKLMVGPSNGWPIVLAPPNDLLGLVVVEGIETGLSIHEATGLGVWAAGAAGRMPALADKVPDWIDTLVISAETDKAGRAGGLGLVERLKSRGIRADLQFLEHREAA